MIDWLMRLGLDFEEVFQVFGEGMIVLNMGLQPDLYQVTERKAQRVRDGMLDLGCPSPMVQRFEAAASRIHRSGDPLPYGLDPKGFSEMAAQTGSELGQLMSEVRNQLGEDDAIAYDVGVMLARLSLCLRAIGAATNATSTMVVQYRDMYLKELLRVASIVALKIDELRAMPAWNSLPQPELRRSVAELSSQLARWDGGSNQWCQIARVQTEEVLASLGMVGRMTPPRPDLS